MSETKRLAEYIEIKFSDAIYRIDAEVVATNRAAYYASKEGDTTSQNETFQHEFNYSLSAKEELTDWLFNNMNWEDVSAGAVLVRQTHNTPDYSSEFSSGEAEATVRFPGDTGVTA